MALASVALQEARVLLNDANASLFTDTVLLPFLQKAYRELLLKLDTRQSDTQDEISSAILVTAGATSVTLPADLIRPTKLEEKAVGASDDDYIEMSEQEWEENIQTIEILRYWAWREEAIRVPGATVDRSVRIFYVKSLTAPVNGASQLNIGRAETFLATRTAALAARYIQQDMVRAEMLDEDTGASLKDYFTAEVRSKQGKPTRRRPYGSRWYTYNRR